MSGDVKSRTSTPPVPGRPEAVDGLGIDVVTLARLWENPSWFAFRFNYLSLRYNIPLYGSIERRYGLMRRRAVIYSLGLRDMVTARDIGVSYGFPKNTLSRAIASLEKQGLVSRQRHPTDKRSWLLSLTPEGTAHLRCDAAALRARAGGDAEAALGPRAGDAFGAARQDRAQHLLLARRGRAGLPPFPDDPEESSQHHDASAA